MFRQTFTSDVHLDYETFSEIDLPKHGLMRYATHPSTEVLFLTYAFNDEAPQQWFPADGPMPKRLREALRDPYVRKCAHNAQFERIISKFVLDLDIPIREWYCTQAHAFWLSLPGDLDTLCDVIRVPQDKRKLKEGKRLIRKFCMTRKASARKQYTRCTPETDPVDWALFLQYGLTDIESERYVGKKLAHFPMSQEERELWILDQQINEAGIPFDKPFVQAALKMIDREKLRLYAEITKITGVEKPTGKEFLPWIRKHGYPFTNLKAASIRKALEDWDWNMSLDCCAALRLHQEVSKSSLSKFVKMLDIEVDGLLYFTMQFAGAGRTARWAGRAIQPQNFPRPPKELEEERNLLEARKAIMAGDFEMLKLLCPSPMNAIAACIRTALRAPVGFKFVACDLASIEAVVIAWLANCNKLIEVFVKNQDVYKVFASRMFNVPYEEVTKRQRQMAKPGVLGAGYRLSGGIEVGEYPEVAKTGLWRYAEDMGVEMTQAESAAVVRFYRNEYEEIVNLWYELERAVEALLTKGEKSVKVGPIVMDLKAPFLRMRLPSGRYLHYLRPMMKWKKVQVGMENGKPKFKNKLGFTYEGYNLKKKWTRIDSHGGKIVENLVQAIARELLAAGLLAAHKKKQDLRMHVHDEAVTLVPDDTAEIGARILRECLTNIPAWWGKRMPIRASEAVVEFYQK